jgi:hypothetical protein
VPEDVADRRMGRARVREQGAVGGVMERTERIGLGRPIEVPEGPGKSIEMMLGPVVVVMNQEIADCKLLIADCKLLIADLLGIADLLRIVDCLIYRGSSPITDTAGDSGARTRDSSVHTEASKPG